METDLIDALVYGGFGIQGISETAFYRFISSANGLSQLGIESTDPPKLLEAYRRTLKVSRSNRVVTLHFGDQAQLKLMTPHPYAGIQNLHVESWLEFVLDEKRVASGFVPRVNLSKDAQKHIRVQSAPGGLMLPQGIFGSTGSWSFPASLMNYEDDWFRSNVGKIEKAIQDASIRFLSKRTK